MDNKTAITITTITDKFEKEKNITYEELKNCKIGHTFKNDGIQEEEVTYEETLKVVYKDKEGTSCVLTRRRENYPDEHELLYIWNPGVKNKSMSFFDDDIDFIYDSEVVKSVAFKLKSTWEDFHYFREVTWTELKASKVGQVFSSTDFIKTETDIKETAEVLYKDDEGVLLMLSEKGEINYKSLKYFSF